MEEKQTRKRYTLDEKVEMLEASRELGLKGACKKYGVKYATLCAWRARMKEFDLNMVGTMYLNELERLEANLEKQMSELQVRIKSVKDQKESLNAAALFS